MMAYIILGFIAMIIRDHMQDKDLRPRNRISLILEYVE